MPDYKKRKRNKILSKPKPQKKSRAKALENHDIKMSSGLKKSEYSKASNIKVIEGRRLENKKRFKATTITVILVTVAVLIVNSVLPAGILQSAKTAVKLIGAGSFPISLESSQTVNTVRVGTYYYVLGDTYLCAVSNGGKLLFNYQHGFEKPVLKTSNAGALVYNQGSKEFLLFDIYGLKNSYTAEKNILTANISDSGNYVLATVSDKYASAVTVYKKNGKKLYEWFSAEDTVNNVALSKNGRKLAVSVFNSKNGEFSSKINVFNFKSATPLYSESFEKGLIYNIDTSFSTAFAVITENKVKVIKWGSFKFKEYKNDYTLSILKPTPNGYVAVFNRQSDKTDNRIAILGRNGKIKKEIVYSGIISDIDVNGSHIYCMSDTEITTVTIEGQIKQKTVFGFGGVNVCATSSNAVTVITDSKIEKVKLVKE